MTAYSRGVRLFRAATADLIGAELLLPVPSCPGWTVSDVLTHVADNHEAVLSAHGVVVDVADVLAVYEEHLTRQPRAILDAVELMLHGWDIARARGMSGELDDATLDFLLAFAVDAGEQLYVDGAFDLRLVSTDVGRQASVLALYGRDARAVGP